LRRGNSPSHWSFSVDPANVKKDIVGYLYEGLVRVQDGKVIGARAESFTVSEDGLDYILNLRSGATFHDGSTFDAHVVIKNFNRWYDPKDANRGDGDFFAWASNFGGFKDETTSDGKAKSIYDGIEQVNDFTVLIHLNTRDPRTAKPLAVLKDFNSQKFPVRLKFYSCLSSFTFLALNKVALSFRSLKYFVSVISAT